MRWTTLDCDARLAPPRTQTTTPQTTHPGDRTVVSVEGRIEAIAVRQPAVAHVLRGSKSVPWNRRAFRGCCATVISSSVHTATDVTLTTATEQQRQQEAGRRERAEWRRRIIHPPPGCVLSSSPSATPSCSTDCSGRAPIAYCNMACLSSTDSSPLHSVCDPCTASTLSSDAAHSNTADCDHGPLLSDPLLHDRQW